MNYRDFRKVFSVFLLETDNRSIQTVLGSLNFLTGYLTVYLNRYILGSSMFQMV